MKRWGQRGKQKQATRRQPDRAEAKTKSPRLSLSDFVRSQHAYMSTADVIAKGKESGMTLSPGLVATVRSRQRSSKGPSIARNLALAAVVRPGSAFNSLEVRFVEMALAIGFARASELLERVKIKVAAMLR